MPETFWSIEFAVPFEGLGVKPKPGDVWGFNLCRTETRLREYSAWAYTPGAFADPRTFGHLIFGE